MALPEIDLVKMVKLVSWAVPKLTNQCTRYVDVGLDTLVAFVRLLVPSASHYPSPR